MGWEKPRKVQFSEGQVLILGGLFVHNESQHLEKSLARHKHSHVYGMNERDLAFILRALSSHERFEGSRGMFESFSWVRMED